MIYIDFIKIILTALLALAELFILTKIMGKRQISELSFFDYISGISIGSIAAEMASETGKKFYECAIAMAVFGLIALLISFLTDKSRKARGFLNGKTTVLFNNGKIYYKGLKESKVDINEFLSQCRINGYFNLDDLQSVLHEQNGKFSFLPKAGKRPMNPNDMNLAPDGTYYFTSVIIDGKVLPENLKKCGKDDEWLKKQLKLKGMGNTKEIIFAGCDQNDKLVCYKKTNEKLSENLF